MDVGERGKMERLGTVLAIVTENIMKVATLASPVMPNSSAEVYRRLSMEPVFTDHVLEGWNNLKGKSIIHGEHYSRRWKR